MLPLPHQFIIMPMIELSIVVPAYNESARIKKNLEKICQYLLEKGASFELIVVDDGSVDDTADKVEAMSADFPQLRVLKHPHRGKGAAVKAGILAAAGKFILMSDADLSTPIEEMEKLKAAINSGYDLAVGSRRAAGAVLARRQPWLRQSIGKAFGFFTRLLVPTGVLDTQCGFKLFAAAAAKKVFSLQKIDGFSFDIEILALAKRLRFKTAEVAVLWRDEKGSKVRPLRDLPAVIREILKLRLRLWKRGEIDCA